jgi:predicted CXXCH cytochrome family protein
MNSINTRRMGRIALAVLALTALYFAVGAADVPFSHPTHREAGAECANCHPNVAASKSGSDALLPVAQACLECHSQEDLTGWGGVPAGPAALAGFPRFSHQAHLALTEGDCTLCHGALTDPKLAETDQGAPGHTVCFTCHDGGKVSNRCEGCHADVTTLRPLDHGPDYQHTHQFSARGSSGQCESCHRQSELCSQCHQGENVLFLTHDRNYRFTHPLDARKHESDCTSCHEAETFCNDCHAREGIAPESHADNWISGLNRHAVEARRDIAYCAGCHSEGEPVCVGCHRDANPGRGNDRSIHPSGFNDYSVHGPWHDDDGYYCFDCHTRSTAADRFCQYCHGARN